MGQARSLPTPRAPARLLLAGPSLSPFWRIVCVYALSSLPSLTRLPYIHVGTSRSLGHFSTTSRTFRVCVKLLSLSLSLCVCELVAELQSNMRSSTGRKRVRLDEVEDLPPNDGPSSAKKLKKKKKKTTKITEELTTVSNRPEPVVMMATDDRRQQMKDAFLPWVLQVLL